MIKVNATIEQIQSSKLFATKCYEKRKEFYSTKRSQSNPKTIIQQIYSSKVFEFAVYNYLKSRLPSDVIITIPSVDIYDIPEYDADIVLSMADNPEIRQNINIKFQENYSIQNYGLSWMFSKTDTIFKRKPSELMLLGAELGDSFNIVSLGFVQQYEKYLDQPKKESQKASKFAIYFEDTSDFKVNDSKIDRILT